MESIPGVDLKEELAQTEHQLLEETRAKLRLKIAHILGAYGSSHGNVKALTKQLDAAKASANKYQEQLKAISNGDWSVIKDDQPNQSQKPEQKINITE